VTGVAVVAGYALQESLRRRVFAVVLVLTIAFLALYWLGADQLFDETDSVVPPPGIDAEDLVGATLLGLAMFGTLFLGTVLAVFLTLGAVRGDAERGLLQPIVVRPVGRAAFVVARFLAGAVVAAAYAVFVFAIALVLTGIAGDWWPDRVVVPALQLAAGVVLLTALSVLGSVLLSATANGIAVFMLFGAGLVAGLLGQIGVALDSETLRDVADVAAWLLPFEALYQDALHEITSQTSGFTQEALQLGPFGGADSGGTWLPVWSTVYLVGVLAAAIAAFARRDL
jgi:Cu-processing system permease protein